MSDYQMTKALVNNVVYFMQYSRAAHWLAPMQGTIGEFRSLFLETEKSFRPKTSEKSDSLLGYGQRIQLLMEFEHAGAAQPDLFAAREEQLELFQKFRLATRPFTIGNNVQARNAIDGMAEMISRLHPAMADRAQEIAGQGREAYADKTLIDRLRTIREPKPALVA